MKNSRASGFYMALPTAATSNQMYDRIQSFFKNKNITTLTSSNKDQVDYESDEKEYNTVHESFRPARRSLLAPYAVGTVDQSLMAALFVKFGVLRLLGLSNKVLIIDEVHAYDVFMSTILERLLNWYGALAIPVIMLSATLPSKKKNALIYAYRQASEEPSETFSSA